MNAIVLSIADALSNGVGLVLLAAGAIFIAALVTDHIRTIRTSITKESHRHDPHA